MTRGVRLWLVIAMSFIASGASVVRGLGQDPVKLSPQYYTIRLENDRVRVMDYRLKPGEKEVMHSHPRYVACFLSGATLRSAVPNGTVSETTVKAGDVVWRDPLSHTTENIGSTELHVLVVELKVP